MSANGQYLLDHNGRPILGEKNNPLGAKEGLPIPHIYTFSSVLGGSWRNYWHGKFDEALKHSRVDAMAMRRDSFNMGLLQERQLGTAILRWHIELDNEKDEEQLKVKEQLTTAILRTPYLQQLIMSLLEAIWYGRYGVQIKYNWEWINGVRTLVVGMHLPVNGDKIGHNYDHVPFVQVWGAANDQDVPGANITYVTGAYGGRAVLLDSVWWREKFIIHRHRLIDEDFFEYEQAEAIHGMGIRHVLYWWDWLKREWVSNISDWAERAGMGIRLWYFDPSNPQSLAAAKTAAEENARRINILVPRDPDNKNEAMQWMDAATGGPEFLYKMVEHINQYQERYVVGQTLSSNTEGHGLGGSGVAALHAATKHKIIAFDARNLAETLTCDFVRVLQRWTFPGTLHRYRARWVFDVDMPDADKKLDAIHKSVLMGVTFVKDEVRALTGMSDPQPDDDVVGGQPVGMGGQPPLGQAAGAAPPPNPLAALTQSGLSGSLPPPPVMPALPPPAAPVAPVPSAPAAYGDDCKIPEQIGKLILARQQLEEEAAKRGLDLEALHGIAARVYARSA